MNQESGNICQKPFYFFKLIDCMVDFFTTVLILGIIMAIVGGAIGLMLASGRGKSMTTDIFNERLQLLRDHNKELKQSVRVSNGTVAQMKQGLTLDDSVDLEKLEDGAVDGVITGLISKYAQMAPPQLRPFLSDPSIVNFLLDQAKKNPEQTKEILKQFIGKNGSIAKSTGTDESREEAIAAYSAEGA